MMFKINDLVTVNRDLVSEGTMGFKYEGCYVVEDVYDDMLRFKGLEGIYNSACFIKIGEGRKSSVNTDKQEQVHSPKHYNVLEDIEAIQIIASSMTYEMFKGYCLGNILKYRLRCGAKDDVTQELAKADKYKELFAKYNHMCKGEK